MRREIQEVERRNRGRERREGKNGGKEKGGRGEGRRKQIEKEQRGNCKGD